MVQRLPMKKKEEQRLRKTRHLESAELDQEQNRKSENLVQPRQPNRETIQPTLIDLNTKKEKKED